jgi:hypothetical protein
VPACHQVFKPRRGCDDGGRLCRPWGSHLPISPFLDAGSRLRARCGAPISASPADGRSTALRRAGSQPRSLCR